MGKAPGGQRATRWQKVKCPPDRTVKKELWHAEKMTTAAISDIKKKAADEPFKVNQWLSLGNEWKQQGIKRQLMRKNFIHICFQYFNTFVHFISVHTAPWECSTHDSDSLRTHLFIHLFVYLFIYLYIWVPLLYSCQEISRDPFRQKETEGALGSHISLNLTHCVGV